MRHFGAQKRGRKMRYVEGRFDQFVDQRKQLSGYERSEMDREFRQRGAEMLGAAFEQVKAQITHTDDEDRTGTGADEPLPYKSSYDQMRSDDPDEDKKPSKIPLVIFIIMVVAVMVSGFVFDIGVTMAVFFAFFAFFGFYSAYRDKGRSSSYYEGATSTGNRRNGIMLGLFALAALIPLCFAGRFGLSGSLMLMMISLFTVTGLYLVIGFISSLGLRRRKYTQEVNANAVAYVRTLGSGNTHTSGSHHGTTRKIRFRTSPLFEYTYQGRTYRSLYDRPCDGSNADMDLGPAVIYIDPDHPEDVYHSSVKVAAQGIFSALVCFVIAALALMAFTQFAGRPNPAMELGKNMSVRNIFILMFGSDEEKDDLIGRIGDGFEKVLGYEIPEEVTDDLVEKRVDSFVSYKDREWYYETVHVSNVYTYNDGSCSIKLDDPTFIEFYAGHDASKWHDDLLVFYVIEENKGSDGQTVINKEPLFYVNADEHTYVGTHGAYGD